jgi:hypothetical protein
MTKDETHKDLYPLLLPSSDRPSFAVLSLWSMGCGWENCLTKTLLLNPDSETRASTKERGCLASQFFPLVSLWWLQSRLVDRDQESLPSFHVHLMGSLINEELIKEKFNKSRRELDLENGWEVSLNKALKRVVPFPVVAFMTPTGSAQSHAVYSHHCPFLCPCHRMPCVFLCASLQV